MKGQKLQDGEQNRCSRCTLRKERNMKVLSQTENGRIFKCTSCNKIHIEYKNLEFLFDDDEYEFFREYFRELDGEYWENINSDSVYRRKIIVPVGHKNIRMLLFNNELEEIKILLFDRGNYQKCNFAGIDLTTCRN